MFLSKQASLETQFYIVINLKTSEGAQSFARFFIGNNRHNAHHIFRQLKGIDADETNVLYLEFWETVAGLPVNIDMITCTLDQLSENCRIITKEVFLLFNLEE